MIRYGVTSSDLRRAIDELAPTWFDKASIRTNVYRSAGKYVDMPSSIWTEVKSVYMRLQGFKCGFCERRLERSPFGSIEHDVEHFRPKARVTDWPTSTRPEAGDGIDFDVGAAAIVGYSLLPHHHENYLMSCKTCNTILKGNGFPVAGDRALDMENPRSTMEKPLLCYPIGLFDTDPELLIKFRGIVPAPAANRGHRRRRGQVIINFFDLAGREGLLRERSVILLSLHLAVLATNEPDTTLVGRVARQLVGTLTSFDAAHANCARSFQRLWTQNSSLAEAHVEAALRYLVSVT